MLPVLCYHDMRERKLMNQKKESFTNEYYEILDFIAELQESAFRRSDELLSAKKELEYKKKQQEYLLKDREKSRVPNISMFSPLNTEDMYESDTAWKDELENIERQLTVAEEAWENQNKICGYFERLKNYLSRLESERKSCVTVNDNSLDYSTKLLETQELDRNRISRDLHDSTVQSLTGLMHKTEYCSKMVDKDPIRVKLELQSMIELNKEIINDMREIIYDLRPMSLDNIGLISTVESYCLHLRRYSNSDVLLRVIGKERRVSSIIGVTLYRIIQEACNNAIRHAKAKKISVQLSYLDHTLELHIEDNGIGFSEELLKTTGEDELHGFGLSTMSERARLLSGSFSIHSEPGKGTKIHIVVPVVYMSGDNKE